MVIEYTPPAIDVIEYLREKVACKPCEGEIALAPEPEEKTLDRATPGPRLWAALAVQGHPEPDSLVPRFALQDRALGEYLVGEVFDTLPEDVREVVLCTSVLDQVGAAQLARREVEGQPRAQAVLGSAVLAGVRADPDPAVPELLRLARGGARVREMAAAIGLTERQLHRRCLAGFGDGAKVLQRGLRFDNAMRLARGGGPGAGLAEVAYRAGYADQAHLSREVRALAGVSPTELLLKAV